ncbi:MAG: hypothetical protein DMG80_06525 [Acidobacteria bacterium]|nr:MAG: hypothetical protein DMG80_06525 [Acidobacteriota bacterium]
MKLKLITSLAGLLIFITSTVHVQAQTDQVQNDQIQGDQAQDEPVPSDQDQNDSYPNDSVATNSDPAEPVQNQSAQNAPVQDQAPPKGTGVARVSLIHGDVSTQRGDSGDWATAVLNAPIVSGDRISTSDNSRVELQLDFANVLRIDARTQANITNLDRTQIQLQIARGLVNYSVLKDSEADVEIDAPNLSVHPGRGYGSYRINVLGDDQAEVLVRKGEADISTPQGNKHVIAGQMIIVRGTGNATQSQIANAKARDDFDRWNSDRDNTILNAQSWNRTNRYYVGSEDLDSYGHWRNVPDYGQVWQPAAAAGDWAPYRDGRWVWEPYWGWTWVSYEPWGWAPYHYGRWFMYDNSWVWWPGQSYGYANYRPIWAPAYVSFFGFGGGGYGFGFGFGSVGWLPIGPCDGFYPWWGGYRSRFNVVNIYNVRNGYNYRGGGIPPLRRGNLYSNVRLASFNNRVRGGISTVGANDFGRGRFRAQPVSSQMFRNGRMVAGNLPVVPNRESLFAGQHRSAPPSAVRGGQAQHFFTNNRNRQVSAPRSFDREAADLRNSIQRNGHLTPIVGNQRSNAGEVNGHSLAQGGNAQNPGSPKPSAGLPADRSHQGQSQGGANQAWRYPGQPVQRPNSSGPGAGMSNPNQRGQVGGGNADWRRGPNSGTPRQGMGNGSANSTAGGRINSPADRPGVNSAPQRNGNPGNQDWRRLDRPPSATPRSSGGLAEAPASRDRSQREGTAPTQDRGNDWRRMPAQRPGDSQANRPPMQRNDSIGRFPSGNASPQAQRDPGNWRQAPPRSTGRDSRPQLDMRQPIVRPRPSAPAPPRGNYGNGGYNSQRSVPNGGYSSPNRGGGYPGGGGYSAPPRSYSSPGGGGYSAPRGGGYSAPSYGGGGYSAPRGGGGYSSPSRGGGGGGGQHSSGGNNGSHHGRN